ncbi:MAG: DUF167 domain-containing protein [Candidatus Omnitrophica bacterium]|nr:DUF167 domain-containing protein [Candidatus Omnitrophota bacterium]
MRIDIKVIAGAKKNFIKQEDDIFKVYLSAPAVDGKANKALVAFLAKHFKISKGKIEIIKGLKSRNKTIMIEGI